MYASRWKFRLLHKYPIHFLPICTTINEDVEKDMERTYPTVRWFDNHKLEIKNIIMNFVEMNPALSYMQGMCFISFTLFYVFRHSDFRGSETLYSLHKIIEPLRPIYPLSSDDKKPLEFIQSTSKIILLNINKHHKKLSTNLDVEIVKLFIVCGFPSFFGSWYNLEDTVYLYDHLIDNTPSKILNNMIHFLCCFFIYHEKVILTASFTQKMYILQQKGNLKKIVSLMKTKKNT